MCGRRGAFFIQETRELAPGESVELQLEIGTLADARAIDFFAQTLPTG